MNLHTEEKMKVIITGATGFIGQEVLKQCIANPSVASVVVLSRRQPPAPEAAHPKVKVMVLEDFASYSSAVLSEFQGAHACIWYATYQPTYLPPRHTCHFEKLSDH